MTSHPLDNPLWHSLAGPHAQFAQRSGDVLGYRPEIAAFVAVEDPAAPVMTGLGEMIGDRSTVAFATNGPIILPAEVEVERVVEVPQMVLQQLKPAPIVTPVMLLGAEQAPAMIDLVQLTQPGPFQPQTWRMGRFRGIFDGGRLAAMTGERMKLEGMTEISAVCVHPDYRGRGYARELVSAAAADIVARGETPFLHVVLNNAPAIRLYEQLGFVRRVVMSYTRVRRRA